MDWGGAVDATSRTFWVLLGVAALGSVIAFQPDTVGVYPKAVAQIEALSRVHLTEKDIKTEFLKERRGKDGTDRSEAMFYHQLYTINAVRAAIPSELLYNHPLYKFIVWDSDYDKGIDLSNAPVKKLWEMANWTSLTDPTNCFPEMTEAELGQRLDALNKFTNNDARSIFGLVEEGCDELVCTLRLFARQGVFEIKPHLRCGNSSIPTLRSVFQQLSHDNKPFESDAIYDVLPVVSNNTPPEAIKFLTSKTEFSYFGVTVNGRWSLYAVPLLLVMLMTFLFMQATSLGGLVDKDSDDRFSVLLMNDPISRILRTIAIFAPAAVAAGFYFKTDGLWEWIPVAFAIIFTFFFAMETWKQLNRIAAMVEKAALDRSKVTSPI